MPLLGLLQYRRGQSAVAGRVETGPKQLQADRPELVIIRLLCDCLKRGQPGRHVGLIEGDSQLVAPGVRIRELGGCAQSRRALCTGTVAAAHRPVIQRGGQGQRHRRRAGLDPRPRLGGRQDGQIDPGVAEGLGIVGIGGRAIIGAGLGRADVDQAIEQCLVAPGGVQPVLDLRSQSLESGPGLRIAGRVGLFHGGQGHFPARNLLGLREGLVLQRGHLIDGSLTRGGPRLLLLDIIRRAQPGQRCERQHRGRQCKLDLAPPPLFKGLCDRDGTLALGRLHALLHARQVRRDPLGDQARIARPVVGLDRQAILRQGDQLGVGTATVEPGQGL